MAPEVRLLRLVAQHVAGPGLADPTSAARHLLAAQGQDAAGVVRSLALRSSSRSGQEVLDAYDAGTLVRSWPMRGTLHTVAADDLGWLATLATERPRKAAARRRAQLGLTPAQVTAAHEVIERVARTGIVREGLLAAFREAGLPTDAGRGYHLIVELAQAGALCLGPMLDGDQAFVLTRTWIDRAPGPQGEEAVAQLALRYMHGHGPATDADLARWAGLPLGAVRRGLAAVGGELARIDVDGTPHWLDPSLPDRLAEHRASARGVHLLPGFDEMVLGYADRSATVPREHEERIVPGGNGVFRGTVLVDGVAVATWRRGRRGVDVEPFEPLDASLRSRIGAAVERLP